MTTLSSDALADPTAVTMLPDDIALATDAIIAIDFLLG